ncbi:hypothetical protein [Yersinia rohdei]|uniref:hypothetical protein n=1 Tax=Yersinia rohdei TaxID=29485 RepID=UPI0005E0A335|nr:hypothetical protein [Yersinia rohdei]CQJ62516.1 Uncharacterised protein [Yersinia rohdei]
MTMYSYLDEMKGNFLEILNKKSALPVDTDDLAINYNVSLESSLIKYLALLQSKTELLSQAKRSGDEIAIQSALLRLRSHAMSLSSFFDHIVEDIEVILRTGEWLDIPEDYVIPEPYLDLK